jgi:hypothetical protein
MRLILPFTRRFCSSARACLILILFVLAVMFLVAPLLTGAGLVATVASANTIHNHGFYINYTTVTGYFLQDEPTTNPTTFDYVSRLQG